MLPRMTDRSLRTGWSGAVDVERRRHFSGGSDGSSGYAYQCVHMQLRAVANATKAAFCRLHNPLRSLRGVRAGQRPTDLRISMVIRNWVSDLRVSGRIKAAQ